MIILLKNGPKDAVIYLPTLPKDLCDLDFSEAHRAFFLP